MRGDARLKALQKLETGEVIAGFPDTVDEALHLSGTSARHRRVREVLINGELDSERCQQAASRS